MYEDISKSRIDIEEKARGVEELLKIGGNACNLQLERARLLREKLEMEDLTIAVIGQFKRGKSKLSNRILGEEVFPVGIVPITSAITSAKYGEKSAEIHFLNGEIRPVDFNELDEYISEQKNGSNKLGVKEVVIKLESPFLKSGITYVDTPGVVSFHKNNTETAYEYMKESDGVIFLLSVDSPINQIEIDFLQRAREYAGKFYFAVNKIDLIGEEDLGEYLAYCRGLLQEILGLDEVRLYPVSAESGEGIEELKRDIERDLSTSLQDIMKESARKKLVDITGSALKQLSFYRKTLSLSYGELDEKFRETDRFLAEKKEEAGGYLNASCPNAALYEYRLNELRLSISEKMSEVFEMDYVLPVEAKEAFQLNMTGEEYFDEVNRLITNVRNGLSEVLLYREENAFTVVRRMEDVYGVIRRLRSIKNTLQRGEV